jgi:hypothetical protein
MPSGSHDINVKLLALMGVVSTILIVALIVATQAWFRYEFSQENNRKYVQVPFRELVELQETQLSELHAPAHPAGPDEPDRWVVPIDAAMQQVIEQNGKTN